jgi:D-threo-aldose 1-dehydrogenase
LDPTSLAEIGRTGLRVTRLGLGTAPLGGFSHPVAEQEAERVVEAAWRHGLRPFDTAPFYGHGRSEEIVGRVLRRFPRDCYVLATKVGYLLRRGAAPHTLQFSPDDSPYRRLHAIFDFGADGVRRSHQESLKRLGLDRVDTLHIQDCDDDVEAALADAFPALAELRAQGMIRAVSAGVNDAKVLVRLAQAAAFDCFLAAGTYTLLDQSALAELLPLCERKGISIVAAGVFNGGILASPATGASYSAFSPPPGAMERAAALDQVCRSHGVPLLAAALQFPLGHPAVSCVVIGARSVAELDEDVAAFRHPVPASLWQKLKDRGLIARESPVPRGELATGQAS